MKEKFKGLWPAMFTPVDEQGQPAYERIGSLVELFTAQQLDGIYLLGSTGQGVLFTEEQRKKVLEATCEANKGKLPVIVHVGALRTDESVRLARHAEKQGVEGISSVPPFYYAFSADAALEHYRQIAGAVDLPFFPYQLGDNSIQGDITAFIQKLLEIPNVAGMKLTTGKLLDIALIHNLAGERLSLFSGADDLFCHAALCGTVGAIGTFYNIWGPSCKKVLTEFKQGNYELAKDFMLPFQDMVQQVVPGVWQFCRKAMLLKYQIDIGHTIAPLGNVSKEWTDQEVMAIVEKLDNIAE